MFKILRHLIFKMTAEADALPRLGELIEVLRRPAEGGGLAGCVSKRK
jgi:hypothetical protein